ncbi:hypothetical protein MUK42_34327 [Musa troglodytarum]|uniref:Uncharacterized protein n=1 Tax=Musa troglodytarum TaxID=320322 RepID=A0A9E7FNE7_9LILI|nr:hypothetical protein MUK42_34327 [Musa troglodytarum]
MLVGMQRQRLSHSLSCKKLERSKDHSRGLQGSITLVICSRKRDDVANSSVESGFNDAPQDSVLRVSEVSVMDANSLQMVCTVNALNLRLSCGI